MGPRDEVRAFWTGPALSYYEILSLKSLVATGARVLVYSYESDLDVPEGVELVDANDILTGPIHEFRLPSGDTTLALHSDLFRYIMLQRYGGWYADLDIVCLKERLPDTKTYFAFMADRYVGSAILKFPARAAIMDLMVKQSWETLPQAGAATTDDARVSVGPTLLTRLIYEQAMDHLVSPESSAYELRYYETMAFFDPAQCEASLKRVAHSDFTHLWNEAMRRIRLPKNLGPPKGSFLDVLFERFDIHIPDHARVKPEAVEAWFAEQRLVKNIRTKLGVERIGESTPVDLAHAIQTFGWQPRDDVHEMIRQSTEINPAGATKHEQTSNPQILRTFWHGDGIGPYQLLCLKSFVDRGHRVEVFSYNLNVMVPPWLIVRDATEILPADEVLRPIPGGGLAIHANLFRYTMLHELGGWWIDPDVMLTKADMPQAELFLAGLDAFGLVPTSVLKCPVRHPLLASAIAETRALGDHYTAWEQASAGMLTSLAHEHGVFPSAVSESLGPVSWFNVLDLFDPAKADDLADTVTMTRFLHLHDDVWRRAGIHSGLAAPEGSILDRLVLQHDLGTKFPARMHFHQIHRWLSHMYKCVQMDRGSTGG